MHERDRIDGDAASPPVSSDLRWFSHASEVPACRAVVVFEDPDGRATLLATTADARQFVMKRLEPSTIPTVRIGLVSVGSTLEGELIYIDLARALMPDTYQAIAERWRAWFVRIDPEAPIPEWTKTDLGKDDLGLPRSVGSRRSRKAPGGATIGPLPNKDSAGRLIELLIEQFDLCRFQRELDKAPNGRACAYKEMGRCPAPCDGSESMDSYRARIREAVDRIQKAESTSHSDDSTRPAVSLPLHPSHTVTTLADFRWLAATASERTGWVRILVICAGGWSPVAEIRANAAPEIHEQLAESASRLAQCLMEGPLNRDCIGIASRWLALPASRRRSVEWARLTPECTGAAVQTAARALFRRRAKVDPKEVDSILESH